MAVRRQRMAEERKKESLTPLDLAALLTLLREGEKR